MATTNELLRLFSAVAEDDMPRAKRIASSIAQDTEKKGKRAASQLLKAALQVKKSGLSSHNEAIPVALFQTALTKVETTKGLNEVRLSPAFRDEVLSFIEEFLLRDNLLEKGLRHRSRLLFCGPPGCGKTLTARAIGHDLGLPTYVVRFDALIGSYLGQTAQNIRMLFNFLEKNQAVVIIDEIDALGTQRGSGRDVGELDRIVISMMQQLELINPAAFLICTSNLPGSLDEALFRRFDAVLQFNAPTSADLEAFVQELVAKKKYDPTAEAIKIAYTSKSYSDSERAILDDYRRHVVLHARKGEG